VYGYSGGRMKMDEQVKKWPECYHCKKPALMVVTSVYLCGECIGRLEDHRQKLVLESLEDKNV
jgi:hypothetical protein